VREEEGGGILFLVPIIDQLYHNQPSLSPSLLSPVGHMVPLDKPREALAMFSAFAARQPLSVLRPPRHAKTIPATVLQSSPDKREQRQRFIRGSNKKKSEQGRRAQSRGSGLLDGGGGGDGGGDSAGAAEID
jgi:hypothetical protein